MADERITFVVDEIERQLRVWAAAQGIGSLAALAAAAGTDRAGLRCAIRGTRRLRPATISKLARVLALPPSVVATVIGAR